MGTIPNGQSTFVNSSPFALTIALCLRQSENDKNEDDAECNYWPGNFPSVGRWFGQDKREMCPFTNQGQ